MSTNPDDFDFDEVNGDLGRNHPRDQRAQQTLFVLIADLSTCPQSWERWSHLFELLTQVASKSGKDRTLLKAFCLFFCLPLRQQFLFPPSQKSRPRPSDCQGQLPHICVEPDGLHSWLDALDRDDAERAVLLLWLAESAGQ